MRSLRPLCLGEKKGKVLLGIIFTGGEGPQVQVIKKTLAESENPLVIAADSGLALAKNADVKPHILIGDFDSLPDTQEYADTLAAYPPECIIRHEREKDFTDTELAFLLAKEKGCDEVWIFGGGGGRIDHLFGIRSLCERDVFPRRWITAHEDIYCICREQRFSQNNIKEEAIVSVFPLGDGPWEAMSEGLKWQLSGLKWNRGFFGLSNVAQSGEISIIAKTGRFMVILQL